MLTLMLFRHAKAERGGAALSDAQRPLAARGRDDADAMGRKLAVNGMIPDLVLCSPATRTLETLALASPYWTPAPQVAIEPALYERMGDDYTDLIRGAAAVRRLMLVAHNSATEETARDMIGADALDDRARKRLEAGFPTGTIAVIEFDAHEWFEVQAGQGTLTAFLTPR